MKRLLFVEAKLSSPDQFVVAVGKQPLGKLVCQIVGLDKSAAQTAFSAFIDANNLSSIQI